MTNTLSTEQAVAEALSITPRQVRPLRRLNHIPYIRVNRNVFRYNIEQVMAALEKLTVKPKQARVAAAK
jgi:hypothetical protein